MSNQTNPRHNKTCQNKTKQKKNVSYTKNLKKTFNNLDHSTCPGTYFQSHVNHHRNTHTKKTTKNVSPPKQNATITRCIRKEKKKNVKTFSYFSTFTVPTSRPRRNPHTHIQHNKKCFAIQTAVPLVRANCIKPNLKNHDT